MTILGIFWRFWWKSHVESANKKRKKEKKHSEKTNFASKIFVFSKRSLLVRFRTRTDRLRVQTVRWFKNGCVVAMSACVVCVAISKKQKQTKKKYTYVSRGNKKMIAVGNGYDGKIDVTEKRSRLEKCLLVVWNQITCAKFFIFVCCLCWYVFYFVWISNDGFQTHTKMASYGVQNPTSTCLPRNVNFTHSPPFDG